MKTNQVLTRKMGDFEVLQRTSDGMFNVTVLLKQWNVDSGQSKEVTKFFENGNTKEFIIALISEENLNTQNSAYLTTRGKNGGTWMHPILFIKFAMWLNPRFEVKVIKFVHDQLIQYRVDAGMEYKEVGRVVSKIVEKDFLRTAMENVARAINHVIYNKHESGIRNKVGCEDKMKELADLEKNIVMLIDCGFVKTYEHLMNFLRGRWIDKWQPRCLNN